MNSFYYSSLSNYSFGSLETTLPTRSKRVLKTLKVQFLLFLDTYYVFDIPNFQVLSLTFFTIDFSGIC